LLKKEHIKATFFVTGWTVERYPESVENIYSMGHEIAHHGYHHEWLDHLALEQEKAILEKGITLLKDVTGTKPLGYRSPSWEFSTNTLTLLNKYSFRYSSNMMNSDLPYRHQLNGKKTDLLELPVHWILDDAPFFLYGSRLPGRIMIDPSQVYSIWQQEFQAFYEEALCFVLTMHPQLIGRPSRIKMLDRLIQHMKKYDIWCAKAIDVADFWAKTNP
jgi:peptidoglycan/xylan/chitin deacetylase (PgdA/CDA1 family)